MNGNSNGMTGQPPCRALWKAEADTGKANYFRWTFGDYVLSVGKAWDHAASADTCEVLLFKKTATRVDLFPSDVCVWLSPFDRFFGQDNEFPIAYNLSDSLLDSLLFALDFSVGPATEYKGVKL